MIEGCKRSAENLFEAFFSYSKKCFLLWLYSLLFLFSATFRISHRQHSLRHQIFIIILLLSYRGCRRRAAKCWGGKGNNGSSNGEKARKIEMRKSRDVLRWMGWRWRRSAAHEMLNSFEEKTLHFHAFHVMPVALDCSLNLCAPFFFLLTLHSAVETNARMMIKIDFSRSQNTLNPPGWCIHTSNFILNCLNV